MWLLENTSITKKKQQIFNQPVSILIIKLLRYLMSVVTGDSVYLLPSYKLVIKIHDFAFLNRDWTRMNILFGKYAVITHFIQQTISKYKTITFTYRLYKACKNFIFSR